MKLFVLLVVAIFFGCAFSSLTPAKKQRTFSVEPNAVDIEFLGSCDRFSSLASFMSVNSWTTTGPTPDCLPIAFVPSNPDINDISAQYICNQVGRSRSFIRVVETHPTSLSTNHPDTTPPNLSNVPFILGFKSNRPFRAAASRYYRRPTCAVRQDFCDSTNYVVQSCSSTNVTVSHGWVLNNDIVYIFPHTNAGEPGQCDSPTLGGCCAYIAPTSLDPNGMCPHTPSTTLNQLPARHYKSETKKPHRPVTSAPAPPQQENDNENDNEHK